jgi:hypothetical protein
MFELAQLSGTPRRSIVVQTRLGTNLENYVPPEPSFQHINLDRKRFDDYGRNWEERKPPAGGYNCAGMVWAIRRAALTEPDDWRRILVEDGYRPLRREPPAIGDVVAYVKRGETEILHVARICRIERIVTPSGPEASREPILRALSKWDQTSSEAIHAVDDVPPLNGGEEFVVQLWTDRPMRQVRS